MNVREIKRIAFVGIGGIGMSALARFFRQRGAMVTGYDKTKTDLTRALVDEGIDVHYSDDVALVDKTAELVVYTPAIPQDHTELNWYREQNYPVYKRSDVLGWITEGMHAITVGGTHGKTTVSTMIAYLLRETGFGGTAFLGGISANYSTNFWSGEGDTAVIEADEYDRSFLKLHPDVAVLTSMDADHLDIYGTVEAMEEAFVGYTANIKSGGTLVVKYGLEHASSLLGDNHITYSLQNSAADVFAANIVQKEGGYVFDVMGKRGMVPGLRLPVGGMHNVENAVAAVTVALLLDLDAHSIKTAFASFRGVKRRFEYVVKNEDVVYIDDYAHHPEELAALIQSAKRLFPKRKCVVAFQPHLFSRTRDLANGFAHSLDAADEVLLLDIYPAREKPMPGVTSEMIADKMGTPVTILSKDALVRWAETARPDLFITAGAGDIDALVQPLKEIFSRN
jgi:UDP-N-acetylmuramate--alanine ligase